MKICYIDEAGDGRRPDQREADVPPVFVICGLVLDSSNLPGLTGGPTWRPKRVSARRRDRKRPTATSAKAPGSFSSSGS